MFKAKELTEEQVKQIRESTEGQRKLAKAFGISPDRVKLIKEAPSFEEAIKIGKGVKEDTEKPQGTDKASLQTKVIPSADVKFQPPAPLLFDLGQEVVPLDRSKLAECYEFYKDVKKLKDGSFSDYLVASAARFWLSVRGEPSIKEGKPILEVSRVGEPISAIGEGQVGNEQRTQTG